MSNFWSGYFLVIMFATQMLIFWGLNRLLDLINTITELLMVQNKQDELFNEIANRHALFMKQQEKEEK